jgi:hypothetical protein
MDLNRSSLPNLRRGRIDPHSRGIDRNHFSLRHQPKRHIAALYRVNGNAVLVDLGFGLIMDAHEPQSEKQRAEEDHGSVHADIESIPRASAK